MECNFFRFQIFLQEFCFHRIITPQIDINCFDTYKKKKMKNAEEGAHFHFTILTAVERTFVYLFFVVLL